MDGAKDASPIDRFSAAFSLADVTHAQGETPTVGTLLKAASAPAGTCVPWRRTPCERAPPAWPLLQHRSSNLSFHLMGDKECAVSRGHLCHS